MMTGSGMRVSMNDGPSCSSKRLGSTLAHHCTDSLLALSDWSKIRVTRFVIASTPRTTRGVKTIFWLYPESRRISGMPSSIIRLVVISLRRRCVTKLGHFDRWPSNRRYTTRIAS